jgi:acyl-CoA thioesterase I
LVLHRFAFPALLVASALVHVHATPSAGRTGGFAIAQPFHFSQDCQSNRTGSRRVQHALRSVRRAARFNRQVRVLAIGSSSTVGLGASSPTATYVARLEPTLQGVLKGINFHVVGRGMSGEDAQGAANRMRKEVEDAKPDLVIWQVGTNDALRHVDLDKFKNCLKTTLAALAAMGVDVVLINPQYGQVLIQDAYYQQIVAAIGDVARDAGVLIVDRFDAMRELQRKRGDRFYLSADSLHMNDVGYRCMAEQLVRAIIGSLAQTESASS